MQSSIARYFYYAKSICFRNTQTRYDINPRSRSEHIRVLQHISNAPAYIENPYGFISMQNQRFCNFILFSFLRIFHPNCLPSFRNKAYSMKHCSFHDIWRNSYTRLLMELQQQGNRVVLKVSIAKCGRIREFLCYMSTLYQDGLFA